MRNNEGLLRMIKMLVVDIDGTILTDKRGISKDLKNHVKELIANDIKVVIATGRMHQSAARVAQDLGTNSPVISYQGGLIRDEKDNILLCHYFEESLAREIICTLREQSFHINIYIDDNLIAECDSKYIQDYANGKFIDYKIVENLDNLTFTYLNKVLAIDYDTQRIDNLVSTLSKKYEDKLYIVKSTPHFCEFSNPEATKGNAIKFLANKWGIKQEEIMAIGDQDNDIEMLKAAGVKVAMGNATENLKEIATYITKTVDEDGVVHAINKFIGIKV